MVFSFSLVMKSRDCAAINLKTLKLELILSRGFDGFGSYITGSKDEELKGEAHWLNYIAKQLLFIWENPCRMQTVRLHQHRMIYWKYQCSTPCTLVQIMFLIVLESIGRGREWLQAGVEAIKLEHVGPTFLHIGVHKLNLNRHILDTGNAWIYKDTPLLHLPYPKRKQKKLGLHAIFLSYWL